MLRKLFHGPCRSPGKQRSPRLDSQARQSGVVEKQRVERRKTTPGARAWLALQRWWWTAAAGVLAKQIHAAAILGQLFCDGSWNGPVEGGERAGGHRRSGGRNGPWGTSGAVLWRLLAQPLSRLRGDSVMACESSPGGAVNPSGAKPPYSCCAAPSAPRRLRLRPSDSTPAAPRMGPLRLRLRACWYESRDGDSVPFFGLQPVPAPPSQTP